MGTQFELLPLVDMDGVLTEKERRRIIKKLHSMLAWVGSLIPEKEEIKGEQVDLKRNILELIRKKELNMEDIERARTLAKAISDREKDLEEVIVHGDISEERAIEILKEARGLLRAIEELKAIQDRKRAIESKEELMKKVDDEKRWKEFVDKIKD